MLAYSVNCGEVSFESCLCSVENKKLTHKLSF